jgi:MoxR-like ATPase
MKEKQTLFLFSTTIYYITRSFENTSSRSLSWLLTSKHLNSVLPFILDAKFPVLIRGRHGIGKSAIVYQIAEARGIDCHRATCFTDDRR